MLPEHERGKKEWVNQYGKKMLDREVIGEKVLIWQQPAYPPSQPQILLLTDKCWKSSHNPTNTSRWFACLDTPYRISPGDIKDELIELTFSYVVLHLGTLQKGLFDSIKNYEAVSSFMHQVNEVSPNSYVLVSGLIPLPMDHPHSRKRCENYNSSYRLIVQELRRRFAFNVGFKDAYLDFLSLDGTIIDREQNFDEGIFLSRAGARLLRSI